ncbi:MAG: hypothetical protein C0600_05460 [Ignavibacteria bacterium]|nr:MAG: hypothetical protein C0600_05460 [Ignavibacteria bacterium]
MTPHWGTTRFGAALRDALRRQGIERSVREQDVLVRWDEIVGLAIARQARPLRLHHGVLWITVQDAAWRQELSLMRLELVEKINAAVQDEVVKEIRLR